MKVSLSEISIVRQLAESVCRCLSRRVVLALQRMTDDRLSGDDSCLQNTWDEICVQVQHEHSFAWDAYDQTVRALVAGEVESLADFEREAVWLQTPQGVEWDCDDGHSHNPVFNDDIVEYIISDVYTQADNWSNPRIRKYIDSSHLD